MDAMILHAEKEDLDCADAQAAFRPQLASMSEGTFRHVAAHIISCLTHLYHVDSPTITIWTGLSLSLECLFFGGFFLFCFFVFLISLLYRNS